MAFFDRFKKIFSNKKTNNDEQINLDKPIIESDTNEQPAETAIKDAAYYHNHMTKSRTHITNAFSQMMSMYDTVDNDYFEELEDALVIADIGLTTVMEVSEKVQEQTKAANIKQPAQVNELLVEALHNMYLDNVEDAYTPIHYAANKPTVILFIGVNGAGKTTSIGKLAYQLQQEGKKVLLAAADTFRAGATDQLIEWAKKTNVEVVTGKEGADPAGVIFDAIKQAKTGEYDILLCDTAGRLQNKKNLMNELAKIYRVIKKEIPTAPHETFLVIDATTGQNGLVQAKAFTEVAPLTGVVLSKLDGTAKGGIALAIARELHIPVKFVGLGEKATDISPFILENYLYGLFADLFPNE